MLSPRAEETSASSIRPLRIQALTSSGDCLRASPTARYAESSSPIVHILRARSTRPSTVGVPSTVTSVLFGTISCRRHLAPQLRQVPNIMDWSMRTSPPQRGQ